MTQVRSQSFSSAQRQIDYQSVTRLSIDATTIAARSYCIIWSCWTIYEYIYKYRRER